MPDPARGALPRRSSRSASTARSGGSPAPATRSRSPPRSSSPRSSHSSSWCSTQNMRDFQLSFFIVDALICMVAIGGSRFAERLIVSGSRTMRDRTGRRTADRRRRQDRPQPDARAPRDRRRAGVGFVDDNPRLRRRSVHGVKVLGTTARARPHARADDARTSSSSRSRTRRARPSTWSSTPASRRTSTAASSGARSTSTHASSSAPRQNEPPVTTASVESGKAAARERHARRPPPGGVPGARARARRAHLLRRRGVAAEDAVGLHRRARVDADLPLDRRDRPRRAPRRADLLQVALSRTRSRRSGGSTPRRPPTRRSSTRTRSS